MRSGLTTEQVRIRQLEFGANRLPERRPTTALHILFEQFHSPLIYIIGIAAAISFVLGELGDFAIIFVVVVIDVALGFVQEYRAQQTYLALMRMLKPTAIVFRDGVRKNIEVGELVPGDLVLLAVGDKVPADGNLLESTRMAVDEALLTGESEPVSKPLGEPVFMGSTIVTGRGLLEVTSTGERTELGKIAVTLTTLDESPTPLQLRLADFSGLLTKVVFATTCIILTVGLAVGQEFFSILRTAIVLSVAAIPEGLIIAVTVILVAGMRKVLHRQGLVKRLLAVETLGSVTVVCTDKTGTLTEGRMHVTDVDLANTESALRAMVLCNNLEGPVDIALWEYAETVGAVDTQALVDKWPRVAEELFTSEAKFMIAAVTGNEVSEGPVYFLKGAPEVVLAMCSSAPELPLEVWADRGLRCLGLAQRVGGELDDHSGYEWLGLVGMADPIRHDVLESVRMARAAGIRVLMVTGDHRRTAESIAASVGLSNVHVVEGTQVAALSDRDLHEAVKTATVFARIRPQDKLRIVSALKANGEVTAMIGDGVNDAPALKTADIGVVVGTASDVAKETADLILLDNSFSTIIAAIEEGRVIFDNIRKVVAYVLSNSFAEVATIFGAMLLAWPTPLSVAQILWIHLICDGPEDIVLGFEPKENGIMHRPPRAMNEPILDRLGISLIAIISSVSAVFGLSVFGYYHLVLHEEVRGRSIVFATFAISSVIYILAYRSLHDPIWRMNPITSNRPLIYAIFGGLLLAALPFVVEPIGSLLQVVELRWQEWGLVFGFAVTLLVIIEAAKALLVRR